MIKAILFDMDGTLIDSFEGWCAAAKESIKETTGKEITQEDFVNFGWGISYKDWGEEYIGKDKKAFLDLLEDKFYLHLNKVSLIDKDVKEVLEELKTKYKLAVVSTTYDFVIEKVLKELDIRDYFEFIIGGNNVQKIKPAPDGLFLACEKLDVDTKDTIFIGDLEMDRLAAKNAGMKIISYNNENGADANAKNYQDIKKIISEWNE